MVKKSLDEAIQELANQIALTAGVSCSQDAKRYLASNVLEKLKLKDMEHKEQAISYLLEGAEKIKASTHETISTMTSSVLPHSPNADVPERPTAAP